MIHMTKLVHAGLKKLKDIFQGATTSFCAARTRGGQYLVAKQKPDGSFGNPRRGPKAYSKILMALHACGYTNEANRLCQWIRMECMTPDGDFTPRPEGKSDHDYIYPNSWIIIGAHQLGAFDISQKGMDFLMTFWDSDSGGFYSSSTKREASTKQDLIYVGFAGLAALYTGNMDSARGVGRWMKRLMTLQPRFPQGLYTVYSRQEGLCTQYPPEEANRHFLDCTATAGDQFFFQIGVAGGFLAELFLATRKPEWLDLAQQYMQAAISANDHLVSTVRAGKVGWAASLLHTLTGEGQYRDIAFRVGNFLVSSQTSQGSWGNGPGQPGNDDLTAEMVLWLDAIHRIEA